MDIPTDVAIGLPALAGVAIGAWQWQIKQWIDDYLGELTTRADDRRQFINTKLEELKQKVATVNKGVEGLQAEGQPNLQLWNDLDEVSNGLADIDNVRVAPERMKSELKGMRDWVTALVIGVLGELAAIAVALYTFDGNQGGIAVAAVLSEFLILIPALKVRKLYRNFKERRDSLRTKKLL